MSKFEKASQFVQNAAQYNVSFTRDQQNKFYALNKVATEGPCTSPRPTDAQARSQWESWQRVSYFSADRAREQYVQTLEGLQPKWQQKLENKSLLSPVTPSVKPPASPSITVTAPAAAASPSPQPAAATVSLPTNTNPSSGLKASTPLQRRHSFQPNRRPAVKGFLYKQGLTFKAWSQRYFYLDGTNFAYFSDPQDHVPRATIPLSGAIVEGVFEEDGLFTFSVRCPPKEGADWDFFYLGHETKTEAEKWHAALLAATDSMKEPKVESIQAPALPDKEVATRSLRRTSVANPGLVPLLIQPLNQFKGAFTRKGWKLSALSDGCCIYAQEGDLKVPRLKACTFVDAPPEVVFRAAMDVSSRQHMDPHILSVRVVQPVDNHTDILHIVYKPMYGGVIAARDVVILRFWWSETDGSYTILEHSIQHETCKTPAGCVRAVTHASGFRIKPQDDWSTKTVIISVQQFEPKGWITKPNHIAMYQSALVLNAARLRDFVKHGPVFDTDMEEDNPILRVPVAAPQSSQTMTIRDLDTGAAYSLRDVDNLTRRLSHLKTESPTATGSADLSAQRRTKKRDLGVKQHQAAYEELLERCKVGSDDSKLDSLTVLRFLKAKEFQVDKAEAALKKYVEWRESFGVDRITESHIQNELRKGVMLIHKHDNQNRPVIYFRARLHLPQETDIQEYKRFVVWTLEKAVAAMEGPVEQFVIVMDMKNTSYQNTNLNFIQDVLPMIQDFYPERLGACFVVNTPWAIRLLWKTVKPWLDPNTVAKIHFLSSNQLSTLLDFFSPDCLPAEFGGNDSTSFT